MNNDIRKRRKIIEYINTPIEHKVYKALSEEDRKILSNYIKDLQQRIDKAIDYIKQDYERNEEIVDYCAFKPFYNNLLKILGGDSLE